jgi:hypothetical protein
MQVTIAEVENSIDIGRNQAYFDASYAHRVVFLTEAQRLLTSLLNAELEKFIETEVAAEDNALHSQ